MEIVFVCLFNGLSFLIFNKFDYYVVVRQKIYDYLENNINKKDEADINDEKKKIQEMKKDGEFGTVVEIEGSAF